MKVKKIMAMALSLMIVVLAAIFAWLHLRQLHFNPLSEDASIEASVVHISTSVPGQINALYVQDGDQVKQGQLLFSLDPELYQLRLEQVQAELALTQATLNNKKRIIIAESHNATVTNEQIERARTNLKLAIQSQARLAALAPKGYVPQQQLDQANTLKSDAEISLRQALAQSGAADALVSNTEAEAAMVEISQRALAMAKHNLQKTNIYAPHDGYVAGLSVATGEHVLPNISVFTLITSQHWHAAAMYRETELKRIRPGMCATVYVLADPTQALKGRVDSVGWGVMTEDMITLPRSLPYVQKSMNWVRVAQRFPVRIRIEAQPDQQWLLRMGASATTIIHDGALCE